MTREDLKEKLRHCLGGAPTTENQLEAMTSLAEDIGLTMFKASSVLRYHREGNTHMAAASFSYWEMPGGKFDPSRHAARERERILYLTP